MTRVGASSPLNFDLVRDEIPNASIDLSYEIRPGIGYLHIRQFQETTGREFDDAIESFGPRPERPCPRSPPKSRWRARRSRQRLRSPAEARDRSSSRSAAVPSLSRSTAPPTATKATVSPSSFSSIAHRLRR